MTFNRVVFIIGMTCIGLSGLLLLIFTERHYRKKKVIEPHWVSLSLAAFFVVGILVVGILSVNKNQLLVVAGLLPIALIAGSLFYAHSAFMRRGAERAGHVEGSESDDKSS